jgi:hypothetical protein
MLNDLVGDRRSISVNPHRINSHISIKSSEDRRRGNRGNRE